MFAKKKKAVFENSATIAAPPPSSVTNSSGKSASYDPQFYASDKKTKPKMLSPPPAVPAAPVPQSNNNTVSDNNSVAKQLIFHCQLAHGSQTGFITGFSSVRELYQKIADYYEFPVEEVTVVVVDIKQKHTKKPSRQLIQLGTRHRYRNWK